MHYGDTHGFDKDKPRPNAWPYRDWVIGALNDDLPYARFVELQLAGDVLDGDDGVPATGFVAAGPWDFVGHAELREGTTDKAITRSLDRDDMLRTAMSSFCSVTAHCARCHDHKCAQTPIPSRDYYRLQAVFAGVDRADRRYSTREDRLRLAALDDETQRLAQRVARLDATIAAAAGEPLRAIDEALARARDASSRSAPLPVDANAEAILGWHSNLEASAEVSKWVQVDLGASVALDGLLLVPCHGARSATTTAPASASRCATTSRSPTTRRSRRARRCAIARRPTRRRPATNQCGSTRAVSAPASCA